MKNALKLSLFGLAVSLSIMACSGNKTAGSADTGKIDSSTSVKTYSDSVVKTDTPKMAGDTGMMKPDTMTKIVNKSTETKKTVVKKKQ